MELEIRFDPPGFFVNDPRVVVRVEGRVVHDGSFKEGFVARLPIQSHKPSIETTIYIGPLQRKQRIEVDLASTLAPGYQENNPVWEARLHYSRMWGNIKRRVDLRRIR
jgi:hypothetical protein